VGSTNHLECVLGGAPEVARLGTVGEGGEEGGKQDTLIDKRNKNIEDLVSFR